MNAYLIILQDRIGKSIQMKSILIFVEDLDSEVLGEAESFSRRDRNMLLSSFVRTEFTTSTSKPLHPYAYQQGSLVPLASNPITQPSK
jgi:hypothetical protein